MESLHILALLVSIIFGIHCRHISQSINQFIPDTDKIHVGFNVIQKGDKSEESETDIFQWH